MVAEACRRSGDGQSVLGQFAAGTLADGHLADWSLAWIQSKSLKTISSNKTHDHASHGTRARGDEFAPSRGRSPNLAKRDSSSRTCLLCGSGAGKGERPNAAQLRCLEDVYTILAYIISYCIIICYAMLCYAMLCYAMLCCAVLCCAVLCCAVLCCAVLCYAMLCYDMLCCDMLCYDMLCYAMLCYEMI